MSEIILWMSVSLDGYIEGPDGDLSWSLIDEELHQFFNDEFRGMGAFLNGRVVYELMAEFWPYVDNDPANIGPIAEFAAIWRDMPKVVYSQTLKHAEWNASVVREVVPSEVQKLKDETDGDLLLGGADLGNEFLRLDLIDQLALVIHPVVVGRGKLLFQPLDGYMSFDLMETRRFGNGVLLLRYRRSGR